MSIKITKRVLYGNESTPLKKTVSNNTHNWTLFIRPFNEEDVELFNVIDSVTFHLHESFQNPHRRISQPPYEITEQGWGEFEAVIEISFKYNLGQITFKHFIILFNQDKTKKSAISHVCYDQFIFINPNEGAVKALSTKPVLPPNWKQTPKGNNLFSEEKDALKRVQTKLNTTLEKLEKEYHQQLSSCSEQFIPK
ncbi:YEATS domain-containing protein, putative [Entamoeba dispar SAW760]|uniref:YEATS domain-containing protein, putative n=1 Tax=Entamoeba dispar (strain ATCC PRA-260 / SAW760) TaxID=370354 RepID=B0EK91_ENTDS|nr:YEATS domain-containing protein, putative [Entamoeba dispar SAW760]EDR25055.1 YEATS domain-containing protein, putative [Entamoeba dispar SAW760]|eukprot:EDR25055.1 YEATS domain-containing protein, putative [Entamoeba dispar SAW760]